MKYLKNAFHREESFKTGLENKKKTFARGERDLAER